MHSIARYVTLYRARDVKPYQWDSVRDTYHRSTVELIRARHRLLRVARAYGRELHGRIRAVDEHAAGAVAYVLLDDGQPSDVVRRFFLLDDETVGDDDPRTAMRRALAELTPADGPQRTMGIMLKAWGLWVTGSTARQLSWRDDQPIPRVAGWPSFSIPTPIESPQ